MDQLGQLGTVRVTHGVRAQALHELAHLGVHAGLDGEGEATGAGCVVASKGLRGHQHSFGLNISNYEQTTA